MNISYKWLKRYIDFTLSPEELTQVLTSVGLECDHIEEIESIRGGLRGVVIGKVLTCEEHPNSDHLHITTVDLGGDAPVQIVCGAPNVAAGQTVVVATVGCTLYDGDKEFKIKKSKIRGVESLGMICAEDEIGIGNSHDGIMVLPDDAAAPGTPAAEYFGIESDYCLEVELTPNRVDAASHYGVARDLKAFFARTDKEKNGPQGPTEITIPDDKSFAVDCKDGAACITVEDKQGCPRYSGVTIRNVKVQESPEWLKNLLNAVGQRPVNNIVDITNFVLLGLGQPLHCFDLDKVADEHIVVRTCESGTKFTTLDGVERTLDSSDLMICDSQKPLCIAGVFGGLDSGVTESTRNVFIESAYFNPTRVRRTAKRHTLSTDASFRYERGCDPSITVYAARVAACLFKEIAGGEICGDVIDVCETLPQKARVELSLDYVNRLVGKDIPQDLVEVILRALEIDVEAGKDADTLNLQIPTYRVDVTRPCDVVEEILRIYGYNNIEISDEMHLNISQRSKADVSFQLQQLLSDRLAAEGFNEILNNSLTSVEYYDGCECFPLESCVKLLNPLSRELGVMRRTLLYGGLESISHNINRKSASLRFFEFGNVYSYNPEKPSTEEKPLQPYHEEMHLDLWMTGDYTAANWNSKAVEADVYRLKAIVIGLLERVGITSSQYKQSQTSDKFFSSRLDLTTRGGNLLASLGVLGKKLLHGFDIEQPVVYATIRWSELLKLALKVKLGYTPLPKTQAVMRDVALLLDTAVTFDDVETVIRKAENKLLRKVELFDVYEGDKLPAGKKSYAVRVTLQDSEKTLQDKAIDAVMKKIVNALTTQLGAEQR